MSSGKHETWENVRRVGIIWFGEEKMDGWGEWGVGGQIFKCKSCYTEDAVQSVSVATGHRTRSSGLKL